MENEIGVFHDYRVLKGKESIVNLTGLLFKPVLDINSLLFKPVLDINSLRVLFPEHHHDLMLKFSQFV